MNKWVKLVFLFIELAVAVFLLFLVVRLFGLIADFISDDEPLSSSIVSSSSIEVESTESVATDTTVTFEEIYKAYKTNELRAEDTYEGNRYRVTAKINGMSKGSVLNNKDGVNLTMEIRIDKTIAFFYAEFGEDQKDAIKNVNVGDTIVFDGTCKGWGLWEDCVLIE